MELTGTVTMNCPSLLPTALVAGDQTIGGVKKFRTEN
jgi:hypothetical protein